MGPCRIDPFGEGAQIGVCGATADLIVARNLARSVAAGAAAHTDHGRDVVEVLLSIAENGDASGYTVTNEEKLRSLAEEWDVQTDGRSSQEIIADLGRLMQQQFGAQVGPLRPILRAPKAQQERWEKLGVAPRGIDREIAELLHRTHHGVESDPVAMLRAAVRAALADGWGGSMIATDVSDVLFGGPEAVRSQANMGVIQENMVNILVHGHEPTLSERIVRVTRDPAMIAKAEKVHAEGINVAGICCTANEILMRQGLPVAGNYLHQELALVTGAIDLMIVDVQCILPSLPQVAACHHTEVVTTSPKADIPGAVRIEFDPLDPDKAATEIVARAIDAYPRRDPKSVEIPKEHMDLVAGFTTENLPYYMGGRFRSTYRPLNDAIAAGRIRGVVGLVGCNTVKFVQDSNHVALAKKLLAEDVLVVKTGCSAIASAKSGLMNPKEALDHAGPGLREVCEVVGIPPVIHMGSCVDNSRILTTCVAMVAEGGIGEDISELPVAAAAPESMSEKAITIGLYAVASGIFTVFMPVPKTGGSSATRNYLERDIEEETGGKFLFTNHIDEASAAILAHLDEKRKALNLAPMMYQDGVKVGDLAASRTFQTYEDPKGVVSLGCGKAQAKSQARAPKE
jgi:carbon-monoxide dehydrogenase catalytic subunit